MSAHRKSLCPMPLAWHGDAVGSQTSRVVHVGRRSGKRKPRYGIRYEDRLSDRLAKVGQLTVRVLVSRSTPDGVAAISRGLSAATPPVARFTIGFRPRRG